jgi:3-oxoacyl-[acyl-carrier-protein] synthase II
MGKVGDGFSRLDQRRLPPSLSADCTFAVLSGALAQALRCEGPGATVSATCASGAYAVALAAEQLLLGKADACLVGAAEAPLVPTVIAQLQSAGVLGSHPDPRLTSRPFDQTRNGLCLGEGAAFLMLETADAARRRGARPLARLAGWGLCVDDSGRAGVSESGGGMVSSARQALESAGLTAAEIGYVNAHGTGTLMNDRAEAAALRQLFGANAIPPCSSTKPVTGHCLGATPALEAVICIEALRRQIIPPTLNCHQPDPECATNLRRLQPQPARFRHALSNSLGFWGYHAALVFSRND